jgi:hypothetical protein
MTGGLALAGTALSFALCLLLVACSSAPDVTVHGTVTYTPVNGIPPAQACPELPGGDSAVTVGSLGTYTASVTVTITADDGPGNYAGQPWNSVTAAMTLKSASPKVITYTFTAQVPGDGVLYQVLPDCPVPGQPLTGESFTLEELQAGVVMCEGDACPS